MSRTIFIFFIFGLEQIFVWKEASCVKAHFLFFFWMSRNNNLGKVKFPPDFHNYTGLNWLYWIYFSNVLLLHQKTDFRLQTSLISKKEKKQSHVGSGR